MNELIPKQPFFERYEFLGSLSQGEKAAKNIQVVVQFPLLKQGEIVGQVLGNSETFGKLAEVSNINGLELVLHSNKDSDTYWEFYSDNVRLGSINRRSSAPAYGDNLSYVVSQLKFDTFDVIHHFKPRNAKKRNIVFFLAGPELMWEVPLIIDQSATDELKIDIDDSLPFSIEIKHQSFYDKNPPPNDYALETRVLALEFSTSLSETEFTNDAFVEKATEVAEDIILLVSFMSRGWITWYSYELSTPTLSKHHVRTARETSSKSIDWNDTLIERVYGREFLKSAYANLQKLRADGTDMFMPIAYYLSGLEAKYLNEQFTTLFLALEWTKDLLLPKNPELQSIIPVSDFERLSDSIKDLIRQVIHSGDIRGRIYEKMRDLNRPSLRFVLDSLLSKYELSYTDLYPAEEEFSLIKTRDLLFHTSKGMDIDHLILEYYRLRSILERLLLGLLGWRDFSRSPDRYIKGWLHEKRNSS